MGMYTELIFGAELKKDTPIDIINMLKFMFGDSKENPDVFKYPYVLRGASYYFAVSTAVNKMWFDDISKQWICCSRSNTKNHDNEIEKFIEWIKPYIDSGSGDRDFYAIVIYEEDSEPTIYYLND